MYPLSYLLVIASYPNRSVYHNRLLCRFTGFPSLKSDSAEVPVGDWAREGRLSTSCWSSVSIIPVGYWKGGEGQTIRIDPCSTLQHRSERMIHEMEWTIICVLALNTSSAMHETCFTHSVGVARIVSFHTMKLLTLTYMPYKSAPY
jgi:hypothetical protein